MSTRSSNSNSSSPGAGQAAGSGGAAFQPHRVSTDGLHPYAAKVLTELASRNWWEREFLQAGEELFRSLGPVLDEMPALRTERLLERLVEPERIISFRVSWLDDRGHVQVNRAWRVQFNSALGPYKGGTRFHASTTLDSLKFLGFEQIFKNALTGLSMGAGKGGADLDTRGRSERELMRFCQGYMDELHRHIGPDIDVPAGDVGVGGREIGYLFGRYKAMTHRFNGTLTGKGIDWGGSLLRPEATGFGAAYFAQEMLKAAGEGLENKRVAVSGFGNVAWGVVQKMEQLGALVVTVSGPDGFIYDPEGVRGEKVTFLLDMRNSGRDAVKDYADRFGVEFHAGQRPWSVPCDIAMPCAIQNELELEDAKRLVANGCRYVVEGANMPSTADAVDYLMEHKVCFAPGKAANAGGVGVSGLEMAQNASREQWSRELVDEKLQAMMVGIHAQVLDVAERYGSAGNYVVGANVAGFLRVAQSMLAQGV